jgi:hypothetical protein
VAPSAGARALLVAARAVLLEEVGPLMTPAGRANVLLAVQRGQPVTITINLNAPPSLAVKVAGEIVAALVFEDTPT